MLKKILVTLAILIVGISTYASDGFPLRGGEEMWLKPGVKESGIKIALYRANTNRPRPAYRYRYFPQVTGRDYYDCTYYKYCNCEDIRFSRCWQCRDYVYYYTLRD